MCSINSISFRGGETAGSVSHKNTPIKSLAFQGGETAGSVSHKNSPTECPTCGQTLNKLDCDVFQKSN